MAEVYYEMNEDLRNEHLFSIMFACLLLLGDVYVAAGGQ
jgi:hypothetical protein